jgi:hypothetical protein
MRIPIGNRAICPAQRFAEAQMGEDHDQMKSMLATAVPLTRGRLSR